MSFNYCFIIKFINVIQTSNCIIDVMYFFGKNCLLKSDWPIQLLSELI